ncbi:hypothetical protein Tsp_00906 [Trichinella spiralis]|uniref:hypothetical protein n=1 Tax=Trichinella spiralis TaxID=6334 RepID=UPI0001EFB6B6|nr:hypothetical protein Tsp_13709 [Trichinella spiralis]XP_003376715.1 hypothetical protein Tsp_00906 [Trichinella spiralis]
MGRIGRTDGMPGFPVWARTGQRTAFGVVLSRDVESRLVQRNNAAVWLKTTSLFPSSQRDRVRLETITTTIIIKLLFCSKRRIVVVRVFCPTAVPFQANTCICKQFTVVAKL